MSSIHECLLRAAAKSPRVKSRNSALADLVALRTFILSWKTALNTHPYVVAFFPTIVQRKPMSITLRIIY